MTDTHVNDNTTSDGNIGDPTITQDTLPLPNGQVDKPTKLSPELPSTTPARTIDINVKFKSKLYIIAVASDETFPALLDACRAQLPNGERYDWNRSKFITRGHTHRLPHDREHAVRSMEGCGPFLVVVSELGELKALSDSSSRQSTRDLGQRARSGFTREDAKTGTKSVSGLQNNSQRWGRVQTRSREDMRYSFARIEPLPYLDRPERSRAFLKKLSQDPGIRAAMRKHKFSVGLLTEMNPVEHTSSNHEGTSRTLGLNRNKGEVIELRLRTDAYDGYRDYKTIRKTLCHELAHNVWGPHDRHFWDLCHQIEKEVDAGDWKHGGRSVGNEEYYEPLPKGDEAHDHGGWTGGSYTLGGTKDAPGLSRRDVMAKAAEERMKQLGGSSKDESQPRPPS